MKKIIALLLLGFVSLTACSVKDKPPAETGNGEETPQEEPAETPQENPEVILDFEERLKTANDPLVVKTSMDAIMTTGSKETHDAVLSAYLRYLKTYQFMGMTPYREEISKLQPFFDEDTQNLTGESITDASLKDFYNRFTEMGYKFIQLEGSVEPVINFRFVENYTTHISAEMIDYGKFKSLDSDQLWVTDGGIVISIEELGERIAAAETFLKTYPDSKQKSDVLRDLENYLHGYFGGLDNTPVAVTDGYDQSYIKAYASFLKAHPDTATSKVLQPYYDQLKANNFAAPYDENVPASILLFKEQVNGMVKEVTKEFGSVTSQDYYVKTTENLNLRNDPQMTSEILWVIPKDTIVKGGMMLNDWVRIETAGWVGYGKMGYLKQVTLNPEKHRMTGMNLNLRQEPSPDSPILMVIPAQTIVEIESMMEDWGKTTYGGKTGYLSMTYMIKP